MQQSFVTLCTVPDSDTANAIAKSLVMLKLAACVNVLPGVTSYYEWKGKIEQSGEVLLVIKSNIDKLDELTEFISEQHPYDVPEIVHLNINSGFEPYLDWITTQTRNT